MGRGGGDDGMVRGVGWVGGQGSGNCVTPRSRGKVTAIQAGAVPLFHNKARFA